jgi:acyl-CoA synthetase (AMP-forming)/AMP-acid ligase II
MNIPSTEGLALDNVSITAHLAAHARQCPRQKAVVSPSGTIDYETLEKDSSRCAQALLAYGLRPGMHTVLMVPPGIEFMVLAFALFKLGAVIVAVDPGIGRSNLGKCLGEARPEAFIGIPKAHLAQKVLGWASALIRLRVTVGSSWFWGGTTYRKLLQQELPCEASQLKGGSGDDIAAIAFTSGSTGIPKGVVYSHRMFSRQVELLRSEYQIEPGEVDVATFPLFALFDAGWGATSVFPEMDFTRPALVDPEQIIGAIARNDATHMFGSPALLNRVGRYAEAEGKTLPSLRRILSAGAPVSDVVLGRFSKILTGDAQVFTPYGATEALPVTSIGADQRMEAGGTAEGRGVCVGKPLEGVQIAVIRISDSPISAWSEEVRVSDGRVGELVVWGDNVSTEYFRRPEANRLAKIAGDDGVVRHRMGDLVYLDEEGRVWFCGRKSHRVITDSGTLFPVQCEGIFNHHPDVYRTALVGLGKPPSQRPVLCVELENKSKWRGSPRLATQLKALGHKYPHTHTITDFLFHKSFPVDIRHNSKIFREKLAVWAEREMG